MKRLFSILAFLYLGIAQAQGVSTEVIQGRILFEQRKMLEANEKFGAALRAEPGNPIANVFYAATRLAVLSEKEPVTTLLDRVGVSKTNRSVVDWSARLATDTNGVPTFSGPLNADEIIMLIRTNILPEIRGALENLRKVEDPSFLLQLTEDEAFQAGPITVDYGDIQLVRSFLEFTSFALYSFTSWNFDAQLEAFRSMYQSNTLSAEHVLRTFPELLTVATTNDYNAARLALSNSIASYEMASHFIRSRPTNVTRMFNLDSDLVEEEWEFRTTVADLKSSLASRVTLTADTNISVYLAQQFDAPTSIRDLLPRFHENSILAGTLPDTTFGGTVSGLNSLELEEDIYRWGGEVLPNLAAAELRPDGKFTFQLNALNDETYALQASSDLRTWTVLTNGTSHLGIISFAIDNVKEQRFKYYRAIRAPLPPVVTIVAPESAVGVMAPNIIYTATVAGQNHPITLRFPLAAQYEMVQNASTEVGSVSAPMRTGNSWTLTLIPAAGQQGAQEATLRLDFTAANAGIWSYWTVGGLPETGTFTQSPSTGSTNGGNSGGSTGALPSEIQGKTLLLLYPGGGGEKFQFLSPTTVSYEDGTHTGTYTYSDATRQIAVTLANGWRYIITLLDGTNASVYFSSPNDPGATDAATYELR